MEGFAVFCQWLKQRAAVDFHHITAEGLPKLSTICVGNVMQKSRRIFGHAYIKRCRLLHETLSWERAIDDWQLDVEGGAFTLDECWWCQRTEELEGLIQESYAYDLLGFDTCCEPEYSSWELDRALDKHLDSGDCRCVYIFDDGKWAAIVEREIGYEWEVRDGEIRLLRQRCTDGYELDYAEELACAYHFNERKWF